MYMNLYTALEVQRLSSLEIDMVTLVQIQDDVVCILHSLGKGMNPIILHPAMGSLTRQGSLTLEWQLV